MEENTLKGLIHPLKPFLELGGPSPDNTVEEFLHVLLDCALVISFHALTKCGEVKGTEEVIRFLKKRSKKLSRRGEAYRLCRKLLRLQGRDLLINFSTRFYFFLGYSHFTKLP